MSASSNGFRWRAADAYLFDIDGTLLNSRDAVHYHAFNHAVRDVFGFDAVIDGVPVHGNTDAGILRAVAERQGVASEEFERKLPIALRQMCAEVERNQHQMRPEICPSVVDLLDLLRADGKLLGIVTGNLETIGSAKLARCGLREYFSFGAFSDGQPHRAAIVRAGVEEVRRRLGPAAAVYVVGDTPSDVIAARAVGVPVIAVASGIFAPEELAGHGPDLCLPCCTDLLALA
jgi:phosphoglycolate phosphatase